MRQPLTCQNDYHQKSMNNTCWRECREKEILVQCWWEFKLVQPLRKTVWRSLKKLKLELPYDPAIPELGTQPEKSKNTNSKIHTCQCSLFITAKICKQPKCSSTDEWIKKMWCIDIQWTYNSAIKRRKFCYLRQHGWI